MAATAIALCLLATGCSGSGSDDAGDSSGAFGEAIDVLPSSAGSMYVVDVDRIEQRLGVDDLNGPLSDAEAERYADAFLDKQAIGSQLSTYLLTTNDLPWNASSLDWEAQTFGDDGIATVRRFTDDVDLEDVAADLEAFGYRSEDRDGATVLTLDLDDADQTGMLHDGDRELPFQVLGPTVAVIPEDNVLVTAAADHVDTFAGGEETIADSGAFDDLVDTEDAEFVYAQASAERCDPTGALAGSLNDEQIDALAKQYAELGTPEAAAVTLDDGETEAWARLRFADAETAGADVSPRETLLAEGVSPVNGQPYTELFETGDVSADEDVETIELTMKRPPTTVLTMIHSSDLPFTACGPG